MAGKSVPVKVINPVVNYGYTIGCLSLLHFHGTNWFTCHINALFFIEYWIFFLFHNNVALMNLFGNLDFLNEAGGGLQRRDALHLGLGGEDEAVV